MTTDRTLMERYHIREFGARGYAVYTAAGQLVKEFRDYETFRENLAAAVAWAKDQEDRPQPELFLCEVTG